MAGSARVPRALAGLVAATAAAVAAAALATVAPPAHAALAAPAGTTSRLQVSIDTGTPLAPALTLTNAGAAPCQVAATSLGTTVATSVRQDGTAVAPISFDAGFDEPVDVVLARSMRTLAPGEGVRVPLRVVPIGPTGHALETVAWSAAGLSLGSLFPVADRPLELAVAYAVPAQPADASIPVCVAMEPAATVAAGAAGRPSWLLPAGGGALALLFLLIGAVALRRRKRGKGTAVAAALLLLAGIGLGVLAGPARPAQADINVDPSLAGAWGPCNAIFTGPGGDPGNLLPTLNAAGVNVRIIPANGDQTHEGAISSTDIFIFWNTEDRHEYTGGGNADPCTSLYHELYHAWEDARGGQDHSPCVTAAGPSGLPVNEVNATRVQNQLRATLGMPQRTTYGSTPLPSGPCLPPSQQPRTPSCSSGCGASNGDPHLITFDMRLYDFQAAGEFVATRAVAAGDGFEIQVRQQPYGASRVVSVNTAVAMRVGQARVEVDVDGSGTHLVVDGAARALEPVELSGGGSVSIVPGPHGQIVKVTWPDGSTAHVLPIGRWGLHLMAQPASARAGHLEGLLGDFDGNKDNDVRPRGGNPLAELTFANLYPAFADSWRITPATSLFTYPAGAGTDSYTDRTYPDHPVEAATVPNRAQAEALCRRLGVRDPVLLDNCILDVALTGQPDFALAATESQAYISTTHGTAGTRATLTVANAGDVARFTFAGTAGQRFFVEVDNATISNACGVVSLRGPDGSEVRDGCVINGSGFIDATSLTSTGEHAVVLDPPGTDTGKVEINLLPVLDETIPTALNAPPLAATVTGPGAVSRLTFTATAGQIVFATIAPSTLPNACGGIKLIGPSGSQLNSACVINARGFLDRTALAESGTYTLLVDPPARDAGTSTIALVTVTDQTGAASIGGAAVTATIGGPGAIATFTFTGTVGQKVAVEVSASTLPNDCGVVELRGPDHSLLGSGCVINGTGKVNPVTLPASGTYTLVLDPSGTNTGTAQLRLTAA